MTIELNKVCRLRLRSVLVGFSLSAAGTIISMDFARIATVKSSIIARAKRWLKYELLRKRQESGNKKKSKK